MNIGIIYVNSLVNGANTIGSLEVNNIANALRKHANVDIIAKYPKDRAKQVDKIVDIMQLDNLDNYDKVLFYNTSINFYGNRENLPLNKAYELMASYEDTIYYLLVDLRLPFQQFWVCVDGRGWDIKKEDVLVTTDIVIVSQGSDLDKAKHVHRKVDEYITDYVYFPLEQHILTNDPVILDINDNPEFDLIYGGSWRSGRRNKKMNDYFGQKDLKIKLFGNIPENKIENKDVTLSKKVEPSKVLETNNSAMCTIVFGDKNYNDNMVTLRLWESLLSRTIVFIDNDFDRNKELNFPDFLYVENGEELSDKIKILKEEPDIYRLIRKSLDEYINNAINEKSENWTNDLIKILSGD